MAKIKFCKNCKFLKRKHKYLGCFAQAKKIYIDYVLGKKEWQGIEAASTFNMQGDCKYYIKKWWKFWI